MTTRRKLAAIVAFVAILLLGALLGISIYLQTRSSTVSPVSTSLAVSKPTAQPREVKKLETDADGDLIITYTDGTTQNAGRVVGKDGTGQSPTSAQISAALYEYCANGRCDSQAPTQEQIIAALTLYCANGVCKGSQGDSVSPTAEQIATAVANYCANGGCKGTTGDSGANGQDPVLSCVARTVNSLTAHFVAWKYSTQPDTAYIDIYKLPLDAECSNPVDLTAKA